MLTIIVNSSWILPLLATISLDASWTGLPLKSDVFPPASRTRRLPAARSHGARPCSQNPSTRPAATYAKSSTAAFGLRSSPTRDATRANRSRRSGTRHMPRSQEVWRQLSLNSATSDTRCRVPFRVVPLPRSAINNSSVSGAYTTPRSTLSAVARAIPTQNQGRCRMKLVVPSRGSTIQRRNAPSGLKLSSSARMAIPLDRRVSTMAVWLARSASVTGPAPSAFMVTRNGRP